MGDVVVGRVVLVTRAWLDAFEAYLQADERFTGADMSTLILYTPEHKLLVFAAVNGGPMIHIQQSKTADTRTCDFANTSKETLLASSKQHIADVRQALRFFIDQLGVAIMNHDYDKLTDIDSFHADFVTGFKQTGWWDRHRTLNRHHLTQDDGIPADVNLIDVLDYIADCVMAGMARSGSVYELKLPPELLERAFQNTVTLLKAEVVVEGTASV